MIFGPVRCTAVLLHPVVNLYGGPCHGKAAHFSHHIVEDLNDAFCIGQQLNRPVLLLALEGLIDFFIRLGIDCEPNAFHFQLSLVKFYRIAYQSVGLKHGLISVKSLGTELLKALKVLEL